MKKFLAIVLRPLQLFRIWLINSMLKLRARCQMASMREAIQAADRIHKDTGKKVLVVYNKATQQWEPIEKQLLKMAHKRMKAITANDKRKRNKADMSKSSGMKYDRVKTIEKKSVYAT